LFESYVENTVLKNSRILSSGPSSAIICLFFLLHKLYKRAKLSPDLKTPQSLLQWNKTPPQEKQLWSVQAQLQGGDVTLKNLSTHLQSPVKGLSNQTGRLPGQ